MNRLDSILRLRSSACLTAHASFVFCVATGVLMASPPPTAPVLVDDFNDNGTNTSLWTPGITGTGPTISETNQRVEIFIPSSSAGDPFAAAYNSHCVISGDYDVQVDYLLLTWPASNGVRVGLSSSPGGIVERTSFGIGDHTGSPREVYLRDFGPPPDEAGITATSDTAGALRLVRTGSTLTPYYHSAVGWIALPAGTTSTAPASIKISAWSHDSFFADQDVRVAFDNFVVNQGTLSCFPICDAAPKTESSVLGINGTVTAGVSGIATVALAGGSSNVSLTVTPFSPGASSVTFRAVQTSSSLNAQGTVVATDLGGSSCTVPLTFLVRAAGPATNETICATTTGEGYLFKVTSALSQPAGTSACSAHFPTSGDALPSDYYFTSGSRLLTIRSPIAGPGTQMELTQAGSFDPLQRLMFSRSTDGGTTFSPLTDVTTSVVPGSTVVRGTAQWSDVKTVTAGKSFVMPTLGQWGMVILSLLLLTATSMLVARRPALAGSASIEGGGLPLFVPGIFVRALAGTTALTLLALAVLVLLGRPPGSADTLGSLVSAAIVAYLVHLWTVMARGSRGQSREK